MYEVTLVVRIAMSCVSGHLSFSWRSLSRFLECGKYVIKIGIARSRLKAKTPNMMLNSGREGNVLPLCIARNSVQNNRPLNTAYVLLLNFDNTKIRLQPGRKIPVAETLSMLNARIRHPSVSRI